ncbi:MAG: N-6 DNA methylase [Chloroflexi bacterium]|nr:N-6 DNA methylase [Chloroflexota bacterium]
MKAQDYLKARGVQVAQLKDTSVGRLSIDAEFKFSGKRGVVVSPKRGSVSDRYLSLLSAEGVAYVVAEGGTTLSFYESSHKSSELLAVRALRPVKLKPFPTQGLFAYLSSLLGQAVKKREYANALLSSLLVARIGDEKDLNDDAWMCSIAGTAEECSGLLSRIKGELKEADLNVEGALRLCAVLSGFRLTPSMPEESAQLIDWVAAAIDDKRIIHGLPLALSPVFRAIGENAGAIALVTSAVGAQFSALSGSGNGEVVLENGNQGLLSLLKLLYPEIAFIDDGYLESRHAKTKDVVVLVPPFGRSMQLKKEAELTSSFFKGEPVSKKYPGEYLYTIKAIEQCKPDGLIMAVLPEGILSGASHRAFRDWLLDAVQILGVVSLPAGFCFSGTGLRCSVLLMKKAKQLPADYSISMIDMRQEDFESDAIAGTIETVKAIFNLEDRA